MLISGTIYLQGVPERVWISTNPAVLSLSSDNVQKAPLEVRVYTGEGSEKAETLAFLTLKVESVVGNSATILYTYNSPSKISSYSYTIPADSFPTANRISIYAYEDEARTKEIDAKQINIVAENPNAFPRSEAWSSTLVFRNGEYIQQDDLLYMWRSRVAGNTPTAPKEWIQNNPNSRLWDVYPYNSLLATRIVLADFGLIDDAVFSNGCMFSQQGVDRNGLPTTDFRKFGTPDFIPNYLVDYKTGKCRSKEMEMEGYAYGSFRGKYRAVNVNAMPSNLNIDLTKGSDYLFYSAGGLVDGRIRLPNSKEYIGVTIRLSLKAIFNVFTLRIDTYSQFEWRNKTGSYIQIADGCFIELYGAPSFRPATGEDPTGIGGECDWRIVNTYDFEKLTDGEGRTYFRGIV